MSSQAVKERRFKILPVEEADVLQLFLCALDQWPQCLSLPDLSQVPRGAELVSVYHTPEWRGFGFVLAHSSFSPIPLGATPERLDALSSRKTVYLKRADEVQSEEQTAETGD